MERKQLIMVAKELTEFLGLEPTIPTGKKVSDEEITNSIAVAIQLLEDDEISELSEETQEFITSINNKDTEVEDEEDVTEEEELKDETDEEDVMEEEDEMEEEDVMEEEELKDETDEEDEMEEKYEMEDLIGEAKSLKDLKKLLDNPLFKGLPAEVKKLKNEKKLAKGMLRYLKNAGKQPVVVESKEKPVEKPKNEDKPKKEKKEKQEQYTRSMAVAEIMKGDPSMDKDEVIEKADKLFVEKGGVSNISETRHQYPKVYSVFKILGLIK